MTAKGNVYPGGDTQHNAMGGGLFSSVGNVLNALAEEVSSRGGFGGARGTAGHQHTDETLRCPWCEGDVYRVRRRMADRFASVLSPRQRYRCVSWSCRWEGTIRVRR